LAILGWKSKLVVGWAANLEIADGLIIDEKDNEWQLTALSLLDEIFDQLIAMSQQMWESC
jgi:hypothetical protein